MVGFYLLFFVNQLKISLNVLKITFNSHTINKMLIYQAIFAINLWTGKKPSFKTMEKAILEYL